ncbi:alpha-beta hydrolase superfamily lysophospholipase [Mumia flava]|uniref:Alpha-beta hydrolase superfamily lysophospholipase n=1 Tax=Mumia flava TaxID=1348852 RepID=A0A0B2BEP4_9ACTN|nr:alpha/beta hydrolase [Mumia flava]PJJ48263.1 alpha-beta hydrolase superfamily lysophospholipase [Mumia flava]
MITTGTTTYPVVSPDGTTIDVHVRGDGRPVVIVHGTTSTHRSWDAFVDALDGRVRTYVLDRRGRLGSTDTEPYAFAREVDDLVAVVADVAEREGCDVDVFGHSYGGAIAFLAAPRCGRLRRLMLYEGWPTPDRADREVDEELLRAIEAPLAAGHPDEALRVFYRRMVRMTDAELDAVAADPAWPARVSTAATIPRELRAFGELAFDPAAAAAIRVPTLLLVGADSPDAIAADPDVVAAAIPDARIQLLPGQTHMAHVAGPDLLADAIVTFLHAV